MFAHGRKESFSHHQVSRPCAYEHSYRSSNIHIFTIQVEYAPTRYIMMFYS